jgi:hypothetical protein
MALEPFVRPSVSTHPRRLNVPVLVALLVGFQSGAMFMMLAQRSGPAQSCHLASPPAPLVPAVPQASVIPIRQFAEPPPDYPARVLIDADVVAPGDYFSVTVTAPANLPRNAWVGIIPSHIAHGDESVNDQHDLSYQYMEGRTRAVLTFQAPTSPGSYELRLHDTDASGLELASSPPFTVAGF